MNDETDADFRIECRDREWKVHKAIVSHASSYFATACHGPMQESQTCVIALNEFDVDIVQRLISYIYTRDYVVDDQDNVITEAAVDPENQNVEDSITSPANTNDTLLTHVEVFGVADYVQLDLLRKLAQEKFAIAAEKRGQADGFIDVVNAVNKRSGMVDRTPRDALRDYASKHCVEMVKDASLMTELAELHESQDFAADMFRQMVKQRSIDKALHGEQMQAQTDEIVQQNDHIISLRADNARLQRQIDENAANADERIDHITDVMDTLIDDLESLPTDCPNARCGKELIRFKFERKGHARLGKGEGDWKIRCKCNAGLN